MSERTEANVITAVLGVLGIVGGYFARNVGWHLSVGMVGCGVICLIVAIVEFIRPRDVDNFDIKP